MQKSFKEEQQPWIDLPYVKREKYKNEKFKYTWETIAILKSKTICVVIVVAWVQN